MTRYSHPRFLLEKARVIALLRRDDYRFRKLRPVIFLCGGFESYRRDVLATYLRTHRLRPLVFYAETVWGVISRYSDGRNALSVESRLAQLADMVLVIVESPGTFAELGAFAISDDLRLKLLPLLDSTYKTDKSFINTGPVRWVDADSAFGPSLWIRPDSILESTDQLDERLTRIRATRLEAITELLKERKHLLFLICDIVAIFGPCSIDLVADVVSAVLDVESTEVEADLYLGLGCAMSLLDSFTIDGTEFYFRPLEDERLQSFQTRRKFFDLASTRAQVLSIMQTCDSLAPLLDQLRLRP